MARLILERQSLKSRPRRSDSYLFSVYNGDMQFSGTQAQLFQAIQDGGQRFQCIGRMGIPKVAVLAAGVAAAGAGVALSSKVVEHRQKKEIKKLVKREVRKAARARPHRGISFDLFS